MSIRYTLLQGQSVFGGRYFATSNQTWADLGGSNYGSWESWTVWNTDPNSIVIQVDTDELSVAARAPLLLVEHRGVLSLQLKITSTSTTDSNGITVGAFAGEETTIDFVDDGTTYSYPQGRFYRYTITIDTDSNLTVPFAIVPLISFDDTELTETLTAVNTTTLAGTITARELVTNIGVVKSMIVTAEQAGETYSSGLLQDRTYSRPDDYVFQENAIIVNIVSRNPPTVRCFDLNGESIDAVIDCYIIGLPKITQGPRGIEIT